ncbi:small CPxCG-related zinc finger protein [Natrialba magadii ATCC 43099]|uniref:Small CPxCG-related zinc finger protein n=1 Tax=Natrialba magadii (strain ATCC 43099 / DSM 3394 / CCM 3739 / CIP 104546 / IAM 13178 / JCM 8861 / NBRC 102185 / NCIMB 2190 / MS3) TaxID=547559 RepID=D3SX53_NATMM|nr:small CPxCG-related zinc finger protein [Natrialba magadii ATCC 43099]ELY33533.1 hypothetical protein C500_01835 [Natrialba magadii ATCC 43099]
MSAEFPDDIPGPESIDCPDCGEEIEAFPVKCSACGCPLWAGVVAGAVQMMSDSEGTPESR